MPLILTVENADGLSGGTRMTFTLPEMERLDIGRAQTAGWLLPDPARFVSRRHCEIRWRAGRFWLYDISTNGTFLNGGMRRIVAPHALRDGDRIAIGTYVIEVAIVPPVPAARCTVSPPSAAESLSVLRPASAGA